MDVKLTTNQSEIVKYRKGPILVKASAGSGKTRVLTERIKMLLNETDRSIIAITFTNKAGEEIKERLKEVIEINNRLFIGTFHSFCQFVLENHGQAIGYSNIPHIFENEADRLELIERAIRKTPSYCNEFHSKDEKQQRAFRYRALDFISKVKRQLLSEDELLNESKNEDLVLLFRTYQDILASQNAIDFDDLILLTYNLFSTNPDITALYRRTYEYICVDEAQDLNYAQYQLLRILTSNENNNIMLVGDPNQSIFAFNGSSAEYMSEMFIEDFQPKQFELIENFRSSKKVLEAANKICVNQSNSNKAFYDGIFEINKMDNDEFEAVWVNEKIEELINMVNSPEIEGPIQYEKIVVLARNKYVFEPLVKVFEEQNIPFYYKITPGSINYESRTMQIFDLALRVKLNTKDTLHWFKLLDMTNAKAKDLYGLLKVLSINLQTEVLSLVIDLKDDGSNFKKMLSNFSLSVQNNLKIENEEEKAMILRDINELKGHWYQYEKRTDKMSLLQFKNSMALGKTNPLAQKNGITLSTVHTMKGQEYDIVFLIGLDDGTFPDYRAIDKGGNELVQEKNNLYVAFTRSKRFLFVTWPKKRLMPWGDYRDRKISRFLKDF